MQLGSSTTDTVPTDAVVTSVNCGRPRQVPVGGRPRLTSIRKVPRAGRVEVSIVGLEGDTVSDLRHHGGVEQAVYAYAQEDLDHWSAELGREVPPGHFGENLTTAGLDLNACEVGETWAVGSTLLQVSGVRVPCGTFRSWMGASGYDDSGWLKRFLDHGRPGPYLRVLEPGHVRAGDRLEVVTRPGHGVTVGLMFRARTTEPQLLPELLAVDGLPADLVAKAERWSVRSA